MKCPTLFTSGLGCKLEAEHGGMCDPDHDTAPVDVPKMEARKAGWDRTVTVPRLSEAAKAKKAARSGGKTS